MSIIQKGEAQRQMENAFGYINLVSFKTLLTWGFLLLFAGIVLIVSYIPPISIPFTGQQVYLIGQYPASIIQFTFAFIIFIFVNYMILYLAIKVYRGVTLYLLPLIKVASDIPFRIHQRLLEE